MSRRVDMAMVQGRGALHHGMTPAGLPGHHCRGVAAGIEEQSGGMVIRRQDHEQLLYTVRIYSG